MESWVSGYRGNRPREERTMAVTTHTGELRELAQRVNDGIEVTLYWHGGEELSVHVHDAKTGIDLDLAAEPSRALDVFYHPFAYAGAAESELVPVHSGDWPSL
jgi:hypothetical protein